MENEEVVEKELKRAEKHLDDFKTAVGFGLLSRYHSTGFEYCAGLLAKMDLGDKEKERLSSLNASYAESCALYKKKRKHFWIAFGSFCAACLAIVIMIVVYNTGLPYGASFDSDDNTIYVSDKSYSYVRIPKYYHFRKIRAVAFRFSPVQKTKIPSSVESVTFYSCDNLTSFDFTKNAKGAESYSFSYCRNLSSVVLPKNETEIPDCAFYGSPISSFEIPSTVTSIGNNAFAYCENLTSITIPESVTYIGRKAFYISGLTSIDIPGSVKEIGDMAFNDCNNLTSVTLHEGLERIGFNTFYNNTSLSVVLPSTVTSVGYFYYGSSGYKQAEYNGIYYVGTEDNPYYCLARCPRSVTGTGVIHPDCKIIADYAFWGCGITSLTVPEGVENIGTYAFCDCDSLKDLSIPSSVTSIGSALIAGSGVTTLVVADGNAVYSSLGKNIIYENSSKTVIAGCRTSEIPSDALAIGDFAFYTQSSYTDGNLPSGITRIGDYAFASSGISQLTISGNVEIGMYAFKDCQYLTSLTIDAEKCRIGDYAFDDCDALSNVSLKGITAFGDYPFDGCSSITEITYVGTKRKMKSLLKNGCIRGYGSIIIHCTNGNVSGK